MGAPETTARDEILGRVRRALATARLSAEPEPPARRSSLERASPSEWRARFVAELRSLGVAVHEEPTVEALRARVHELLRGKRVLSWPARALPCDLGPALADLAPLDGSAPLSDQAACEIGLTGADAAIAETGTLALVSSADHPRTASLLPPTHVAVVREADFVPTLARCFERLAPAIPAASAVNFITGPSRTADIELQLTLGVHGPGELIVVLGP
jgi:L-lactate dehydrogenase complex protein LldG